MLADKGAEDFLATVAEDGGPTKCAEKYGGTVGNWNNAIREASNRTHKKWQDFLPQVETPSIEDKDPEDEVVTAEAQAANTQRLLEAENRYLSKRVKHLESYYAHLDMIVRKAAGEFPYIKPKYPTPRTPKESWEEFVVLNVSDAQLGELIRTEETGGLETYTYEVFLRRKQHWEERVNLIVNEVLRRSIPIHNGGMILGGDIGEGENVYKGQQAHVEFLLNDQIVKSILATAHMIQFAAGLFDTFYVWAVAGNHGVVEPTTLSLDLVVYIMVRALLSKQENIQWSIAPNSFNLFQIGPAQFRHASHHPPKHQLAIHGNNLRSTLGTPNYAADKAFARYSTMLNVVLDHLWAHHHHRLHIGQNWSINGAFPSGSDYSIDKMQGCARPGQLMRTMHQEVGTTSWRVIHLDDEPRLTPDAQGQLSTTVPNDLGALVFEESA